MIKSIRLQNFFGFQDCTINLEKGENVLVGINGSGKSNFFKALELLVDGLANSNLRKLFFNAFGGFNGCHFLGGTPFIRLTYVFEDKDASTPFCIYEITIEPFLGLTSYNLRESLEFPLSKELLKYYRNRGNLFVSKTDRESNITTTENFILDDIDESLLNQVNDFWIKNLKYTIHKAKVYRDFDTTRNGPLRDPVFATLEEVISENGDTLPQVLNYINNNDRSIFNTINEALNKVNQNFERIEFQQVGGKIELRLVEKQFNKTIPLSNVSDGTIRFLLLMTILYSPKRKGENYLICIDEPELGLHPDMINTLYRAIEHAAETSQVIISTHSSHLLDYFELENVRVFEKDEKNATVVNQYSVDDFQGWYESFLPGQMWRAGDIGGKRW